MVWYSYVIVLDLYSFGGWSKKTEGHDFAAVNISQLSQLSHKPTNWHEYEESDSVSAH